MKKANRKSAESSFPTRRRKNPSRAKSSPPEAARSKDDGKRIPMDVKAGDTILFGKYSGQEIKLDGEEYLIMKEDEVFAIIEGGTKHETKKKK